MHAVKAPADAAFFEEAVIVALEEVCLDLTHDVEDDADVEDAIRARITRDVTAFAGVVDLWDAINEVVIMPVFEAMNSLVEIKYIIYGLLLIVSMIYFPGGFCKIPEKVKALLAERKATKAAKAAGV